MYMHVTSHWLEFTSLKCECVVYQHVQTFHSVPDTCKVRSHRSSIKLLYRADLHLLHAPALISVSAASAPHASLTVQWHASTDPQCHLKKKTKNHITSTKQMTLFGHVATLSVCTSTLTSCDEPLTTTSLTRCFFLKGPTACMLKRTRGVARRTESTIPANGSTCQTQLHMTITHDVSGADRS